MGNSLRKTGIDMIGDLPWGTHLCQFYRKQSDLLDILIPYFKAGLENNEFCIWIISEPLATLDAQIAITRDIPDFSKYLRKGQIEIISYTDFYLKNGVFDSHKVLDTVVGKLKSAQAKGFDGLRISADTLWLQKEDWPSFIEYEAEINRIISDYSIMALCTYSLEKFRELESLDVTCNHRPGLVNRKDNSEKIGFSGPIMENSEIKSVSISYADFTAPEKSEDALRLSEKRYRTLADNIPDIIARFDKNLRCMYINPAIEKLNSLPPKAIIGKNYGELSLPPAFMAAWNKGFTDVLITGQIKTFRCEALSIMGSRHYQQTIAPEFDEHGNVESFVCIARDITEQQEAEKALVKSRDELETRITERTAELSEREQQITRIFEATVEGIILVNIGGDIIKANAAAIRMLKLDSDKLQEQSLHLPYWEIPARWTMLNPDGTPMDFQQNPLARVIANNEITNNVEFGIRFDDDSIIWVHSSAAPFINEQGRVEGIVFTFADISEQKQLRDEKELFTKKLIEVQEEERNRISRELHDDTAQWLALLTLEIDNIIAKGQQNVPDTIGRLRELRVKTEKALQEVRRFSHELRPSVLEHFGLAAALELIVEEFGSANSVNTIEPELKIIGAEKRLPKESELVLFRIAQESLSNIRKHAKATRVIVNLKYTETTVGLSVTDNGRGFETKKKAKPGNSIGGGLGLVGMRERAYLIGGSFSIKSIPHKGTTVSVKVPIKDRSTSPILKA